jgi:hypothetical protein
MKLSRALRQMTGLSFVSHYCFFLRVTDISQALPTASVFAATHLVPNTRVETAVGERSNPPSSRRMQIEEALILFLPIVPTTCGRSFSS